MDSVNKLIEKNGLWEDICIGFRHLHGEFKIWLVKNQLVSRDDTENDDTVFLA